MRNGLKVYISFLPIVKRQGRKTEYLQERKGRQRGIRMRSEGVGWVLISFLFSSLLSLEFPLSLLVVLCRVNAVLVVVYKVEPGHHVDPNARVAGLARSNTLHVLGELGGAVELLAALDFVDHFTHVHVDFAAVFGEAVEAVCFEDIMLVCVFCIKHVCLMLPSLSGEEFWCRRMGESK